MDPLGLINKNMQPNHHLSTSKKGEPSGGSVLKDCRKGFLEQLILFFVYIGALIYIQFGCGSIKSITLY